MLFPVPPSSGLVGIARLAEQSRVLEEKRRVEYRELETRRIIGRVSGQRMPFEWTVNPYRGCEFGCKYCYARYTHEFMELRETEQFETRIFAKHFDPVLFRREVARIPEHESIAIGTATDPYQPAERRYRTTRRILEVLAECRGRHIGMVTKSDLVARDARLLAEIGRRNTVWVNLTVTTTDEALARVLEPYAPRPSLRFRALQELASNGIDVTVLCCPVMPLINDSEASISAVAEQASSSGAAYMYGNVLFLKPCAQKAFFPMLAQ
ncbi:MAG TPA: radical SAM protein, partial [Bryobacteraceae bacterium]|nr:radical SAM protein [Bryobacteraceae bacterium]